MLFWGRYQSSGELALIVKPVMVMNELLATILAVQSYVVKRNAGVTCTVGEERDDT
ncbi:MAG: hypothetical protein ACE5GX_16020 [Thermoanaerobaculia bacterium]